MRKRVPDLTIFSEAAGEAHSSNRPAYGCAGDNVRPWMCSGCGIQPAGSQRPIHKETLPTTLRLSAEGAHGLPSKSSSKSRRA